MPFNPLLSSGYQDAAQNAMSVFAPQAAPELSIAPESVVPETIQTQFMPISEEPQVETSPFPESQTQATPMAEPMGPPAELAPEAAAPEPTPEAAAQTPEDWEKSWMDAYNVEPKDIIGPELYNKLKASSEKQLSLGQIIGIMGVMATNPEAGYRMIAQHDKEKADALDSLVKLQSAVGAFKKTGLGEIARVKREEAKSKAASDKEQLRQDALDRRQRSAYAQQVMNETVKQGLPKGVVAPPTAEQLNDPDKFWEEWVPKATGDASSHIGKQQMLQWAMDPRKGPLWLITRMGMDPVNGIENVFKESGHFSDAEIDTLRERVFPHAQTIASNVQMEQAQKVTRIASETNRNNALTDKLNEQVEFFRAKREHMGELTPADRFKTINAMTNTLARLERARASIINNAEFSAAQAQLEGLEDPETAYVQTMANAAAAAQRIDTLAADLQTQMLQLQAQEVVGVMSRAQALPLAVQDAAQQTLSVYRNLTPQDVQTFLGDPANPELTQERQQFFVNLLLNLQARTGASYEDLWNDITMGDVGESELDQFAGQDVVEPVGIPQLAQSLEEPPPTSPAE